MNKLKVYLVLFILCLGNLNYSSGLQDQEFETLKVVTFNIDTNIGRTEESYARDSHPEWRVGNRMPKIKKSLEQIIAQHAPDVIHLQEGRKFITKFGDEVDSITPLMKFLEEQGYQVSTEQYNPSDRSFSYITAIKQDFIIDRYKKFYFTKTPNAPTDHSLSVGEVKDQNYGEEWERCVYIVEFHDTKGRKYRARNIHLGLGELHRKQACEMLRQDTEQAIAHDPEVLDFGTGDFNSFPDWGGPAQLEIMKRSAVLEEVTQSLKLPNGRSIDTTFIAFPYDFAADEKRLNAQSFKDNGKSLTEFLGAMPALERKQMIGLIFSKDCKALCGHLDRIFQHGFVKTTATLLPTPQYDDFDHDNVNEETVKAFIMRHYNDGPAFASDHQPVLAVLQLPPSRTI